MIFCEVEIASRNGFDRLIPYIDVLQRHRPLLTVLQHETKLLLWEKTILTHSAMFQLLHVREVAL